MKVEEWRKRYSLNRMPRKKTGKFFNKITEYNGRKYHSIKEAEYAMYLDDELRRGKIKSWQPQIKMPFIINGVHVCDYVVDFVVTDKLGKDHYIEVKGSKKMMTDISKLKYKIFQALYPDLDFKIQF